MVLQASTRKAKTFLKRFRKDTSANALILMAFGAPMIVGGGGFAIDFTQMYLWQRELQYAADQAALAGAWELAEDPNSLEFQARGLREFQANEAVTKGISTNPNIFMSDYAGETNNAVTVEVSATRMLPFTSYFTGRASTVSVRSQAAFSGGLVWTECLKAVDPEAAGAITFNGNALFTAGCGIAALSTSARICANQDDGSTGYIDGECITYWYGEDAIEANGTPTIQAGTIVAAGTIDDEIEELSDDEIVENFDGLYDQFADLVPPIEAVGDTPGSYTCKTTGKGKKNDNGNAPQIGVATPGVYPGGITVRCDTVFEAGIYVIDGGELSIGGNYSTLANGVLFILTNEAGLKINGTSQNGESNDINLQGITKDTLMGQPYNLSEEYAGRLEGMLIYEDPESEGNNPTGEGNGNMMNGTSDTWVSGTIYMPKSTLSLGGTAQVANICLTIIANKIKLSGTTDLTSFCPNDGPTHGEFVFQGSVKLVA
ncbi:pilus assembly protein TadG-related protein [Croceicoccus naphthovorans]|uniref:Uncharacterized protein n=1 Tax=Croceicoccus naphthovorans TaxID=1348774 RepID=A0A0G3XH73_9SPHN|nr:pilus assembly protein TadG-related protein [Croceicoccus naphthovorans]AKM09991.1 hypothetical protein AB433_08390 [Croceicoccus naphthovorans]MBB3991137.1 Flp pilus assembly protein TadG [Croceicoccus naphthovorans]